MIPNVGHYKILVGRGGLRHWIDFEHLAFFSVLPSYDFVNCVWVCVIVWVFKFNVCDTTYRLSSHSIYFTSHLYLNICAKHDIGIYSIYFTCYT